MPPHRPTAGRRLVRPLLRSTLTSAIALTVLIATPTTFVAAAVQAASASASASASAPVDVAVSPVAVAERRRVLDAYEAVSAGGEHSCGLDDGALWCWGRNTWGQLGNGERSGQVEGPVRVGRGAQWAQVAAGGATTCALRRSGTLWCWGLNNRGQLGDGSREVHLKPHRVPGKRWASVAAGWYHTCAIKSSGRMLCFGDNQYGELGQGDTTQSQRRRKVDGRWRAVAVEGWTTCGIRTDGSLACWGRNLLGQVGDGSWSDRYRPTLVGHRKWNWRSVDLSWTHGCGVRASGDVLCWGRNDQGGLGDGTKDTKNRPTPVLGGLEARSVSTYEGGSCAITTDGRAHCWGDNRYGQVGGTASSYQRPRVRGSGFTSLSAGWFHTCASGDRVVCWGSDERAQLGRDARRTRPATDSERRDGRLDFTIATFNALGEHHSGPYKGSDRFAPSRLRAEWMNRAIVNRGLDVIGVQEASAGQVATLLNASEGTLAVHPDPATSPLSTESTIFWDTTKFTVLKMKFIRTMFIRKKLARPYVKLESKETGQRFWVMAIHNAGWDMQKQRNEAMKAQIAKIKELEATGLPVFFIGDFNEKRTAFCKVLKRTGLDAASGGRVTAAGVCKPPRLMRVDWLFGSESAQWHDFAFDKSPMVRLTTDHWLTMAGVRLP